MTTLQIFSGQINPSVGGTLENSSLILGTYAKGIKKNADVVFLPELALTGYYPADLLNRPSFMKSVHAEIQNIAKEVGDTPLVFGAPYKEDDVLYNCLIFCKNGEIQHIIRKTELVNHGVFDEKRHFKCPLNQIVVNIKDVKVGFAVCEDLWHEKVAKSLKEQGAEVILSANASPFHTSKKAKRQEAIEERVRATGLPILYLALWGGQDELIFDGASFVVNPSDKPKASNIQKSWQDSFYMSTLEKIDSGYTFKAEESHIQTPEADLYEGLKTSLRDYLRKNGMSKCVIGMSGGLDSALSAVIAADALGAENVMCIGMPSPYTSKESINDAVECCKNLGIEFRLSHISEPMKAMETAFEEAISSPATGLTLENMQARLRGMILMGYSNETGAMVLTTGNKSEMAVGYATLYGDMCGGYNVLKDIYKTDCYKLAKWRNTLGAAIPENILTKAPTAELREDQKDEDSLPPYEILDGILKLAIEGQKGMDEIIAEGYKTDTVHRILDLLRINEYKRNQSAPGAKVSIHSFDKDWRMPISGKYTY